MEKYHQTASQLSKHLTNAYSTSFSLSIRLFSPALRPHIYAIYGLVRVADEIVDTYMGNNALELLNELEHDTYRALKSGFSANPIVHAFAHTARQYDIQKNLVAPFFTSMRMDLTPQTYTKNNHETYIDGSAEVVGLMCLKVFGGNFEKREPGARRLGAAYQKVNFLRDIAADSQELQRWYFPNSTVESFDENAKKVIITNIEKDFSAAKKSIQQLPDSSRRAVVLSYRYYSVLLKKLKTTPAKELLKKRIRINNGYKVLLLIRTSLPGGDRV